MTRNERKLRAAIEELKSSGAKINPASVEKQAGVSNGSLKYYSEIYEQVLELKSGNGNRKQSTRAARTESLKNSKNKAMKAKREAESELSELKAQLKAERIEHADAIANLTWALHKAQHNRVMEQINSENNVTKLGKS
ncbi:hypothetical protein KW529_21660 [Vibrio fluvialis]|uniref:hypothetical protein n=1 Tax=Vibrio fluvialis TaxID=676 RepID=UPI001C9BE795|nr:hypothetical protein [Vibrio fluvialis]MBY8309819.1 hypothetical protein [Vibrio fluvialis]BEI23115.1 hypothetical protein KKIDH5335_14470 [Vibrio fluvialis]